MEDTLFEPPPERERPAPEPVEVRGTVQVRVDWAAELRGLIERFPDEWAATVAKCEAGKEGYNGWEAGSVFLHDLVVEALDVWFREERDGDRALLVEKWVDHPEVSFEWTEKQAALLSTEPPPFFCQHCGQPSELRWCSTACHKADEPEAYS